MRLTAKLLAIALLACAASSAHAILQATVSVENERVLDASAYVFDVYLESSSDDALRNGDRETAIRLDTLQLLFNFSSDTAVTVTGADITAYFDWSAYGNASGTETDVQYTLRGYQPAVGAATTELNPRIAIDAWELATAPPIICSRSCTAATARRGCSP